MKTTENHSNQKTVLVVDDDPSIMKFVSDILSQSSYNVLTAVDAQVV